MFGRQVTRLVLIAAAILTLSVVIVALRQRGGAAPEAWATIAAGLAVIAALVSAWTSQRLVEMQEDALRPDIEPSFDARSRYGLTQFRVANRGKLPAFDVSLNWLGAELKDLNGQGIKLGSTGTLPVLRGGEAFSIPVGATHEFVKGALTYRGQVSYTDGAGGSVTKDFIVSAEHELAALVHSAEEPKTLYELQKLPDELEKIAVAIAALRPPDA